MTDRTLDATQWCYALTLDSKWNVTANTGNPNAYYACDADTLATWLVSGHRATCPGDGDLVARVRELVVQKRAEG